MTKRLTKREKRIRAQARAEIKRVVERERARHARLRAEEPLLAAFDRAMEARRAAERDAKKLLAEHWLTVIMIVAAWPCHCTEPGCVRCRAIEIERRWRDGLLRGLDIQEMLAAEERVEERARREHELERMERTLKTNGENA